MYLPKNRIFGFLDQLAEELTNFSIAFDYMSAAVVNRSSGVATVDAVFAYFYEQFTPFITGFDYPGVFERETSLKMTASGGMEEVFCDHAPQYANILAHLAGLYNYCILSK